MRNTIILFLLGLVFFSCEKRESLDLPRRPYYPPEDYSHEQLDIIWKTYIGNTSISSTEETSGDGIDPLLYNGNVLVSFQPYQNPDEKRIKETLKMFDPDGNLIWTWSDHLTLDYRGGFKHAFISGDMVVVTNGKATYCIDLISGNTLWRDYKEVHSWRMSFHENMIFNTVLYGPVVDYNSSALFFRSFRGEPWKKIISFQREGDYIPFIGPPSVSVEPNGDVLLYFINSRSTIGQNNNTYWDLYCYNMTQSNIEWMIEDFDPGVKYGSHQPLIHGDKVIFYGPQTVFCADKLSGNIIWEKPMAPIIPRLKFKIFENNIIGLGNEIFSLNTENGILNWRQYDGITYTNDFAIGNEEAYIWLGGDLYVTDLNTGDLLHHFDPPENSYPKTEVMAIDEDRAVMYISDSRNLFCVKKPE